jgi:hypothetical protein
MILYLGCDTGSHTIGTGASTRFTSLKNHCTAISLTKSKSSLIETTLRSIEVASEADRGAKTLLANMNRGRR